MKVEVQDAEEGPDKDEEGDEPASMDDEADAPPGEHQEVGNSHKDMKEEGAQAASSDSKANAQASVAHVTAVNAQASQVQPDSFQVYEPPKEEASHSNAFERGNATNTRGTEGGGLRKRWRVQRTTCQTRRDEGRWCLVSVPR